MLRARLDCLGVFLVARDDERLFAAGKSGRAEHVQGTLGLKKFSFRRPASPIS